MKHIGGRGGSLLLKIKGKNKLTFGWGFTRAAREKKRLLGGGWLSLFCYFTDTGSREGNTFFEGGNQFGGSSCPRSGGIFALFDYDDREEESKKARVQPRSLRFETFVFFNFWTVASEIESELGHHVFWCRECWEKLQIQCQNLQVLGGKGPLRDHQRWGSPHFSGGGVTLAGLAGKALGNLGQKDRLLRFATFLGLWKIAAKGEKHLTGAIAIGAGPKKGLLYAGFLHWGGRGTWRTHESALGDPLLQTQQRSMRFRGVDRSLKSPSHTRGNFKKKGAQRGGVA